MSWPLKTCLISLIALLGAADAPAQPIPAAIQAEDQQRLDRALAGLKPQRPGVVDAYVIVAALDADPVFNREAREAGRVFGSRFDAVGRTLVLASDEGSDTANAAASPEDLARALGGGVAGTECGEEGVVLEHTNPGSADAGAQF